MRPEIVQKLLALNRQFYEANAVDFSQSRQGINPGFARVRELLPQPCVRLLDVGCGNGRFGQYVQQQQPIGEYVGVDFSGGLLEVARANVVGIAPRVDGPVINSTITYAVNGKQYVAVLVGNGGLMAGLLREAGVQSTPFRNGIYVFTLP